MRTSAPRRPAARSANASVTVSLSASTVGFAAIVCCADLGMRVQHLQPDRVHGDRAPRGAQRHLDGQLAFEPVAVQIQAQVGVVGLGLDVGRKPKVFSEGQSGLLGV